MIMNIVNLLALITSVIILIKASVLLVRPKGVMNKISKMMKNQKKLSYLAYGLFLLVMILVLNEMTLAQIMVGLLMGSLLIGAIMYGYTETSKELESIVKKVLEKTDWRIPFILMVLALLTIFSILF